MTPATTLPLHATRGFVPALRAAMRQRPSVPMATWRTIARRTAPPLPIGVSSHTCTAAELLALAAEISPPRRRRMHAW